MRIDLRASRTFGRLAVAATAAVLALFALSMAGGDTVGAAPARPCTPEPPEKGFRMLFNGTRGSLQGWSQAGPGGFRHAGCELEAFGGMGLYWYSVREFGSYTLRLDWKISKESDNSGVFVGFPNPGDDPWVAVNEGYEIQIDPLARPDGDPRHYTGAIYGFQGPDVRAVREVIRPIGEWNTYEITVDDPRITVRLNGVVVNDFVSTDPGRDLSRGFIGIQNHGENEPVRYRDIRIREHDPVPPDGRAG